MFVNTNRRRRGLRKGKKMRREICDMYCTKAGEAIWVTNSFRGQLPSDRLGLLRQRGSGFFGNIGHSSKSHYKLLEKRRNIFQYFMKTPKPEFKLHFCLLTHH